ncbi:MAG: hypothetical protein ACYDEJ_09680 [Desulfitobacteriaceae bacterium]
MDKEAEGVYLMSGLGEQGYPTNTPLNFGIAIFAPLSSVPGSASLFYLQPLLTGKVIASAGVLIGAELFLFLAQHLFGLESVPIFYPGTNTENPIIKIPVPELQELLGTLNKFSSSDNKTVLNTLFSQGYSQTITNQYLGSFLTTETPEVPLVVGFAVYGDYSNEPFSPAIFLLLPIFTLPGIRGALPLLILGLLGTIFVRAVVPPELSGAKPLIEKIQDTKPFSLHSEDLLNLLNRFGKYFSS